MTLPRRFFARPAPLVARALLGCIVRARRGRTVAAGRILETEAYLGPEDAASHAAFRPASRPRFHGPRGTAYVYRAYGLHDCFNVIAGRRREPGCVLIRAIEPVQGRRLMARRRGVAPGARTLGTGPGNVARCLGITRADDGADVVTGRQLGDLAGRRLGRLAGRITFARLAGRRPGQVVVGPRVGITRARRRALRFRIL